MNKLVTAALSTLLALIGSLTSRAGQPATFNLATYNIRQANHSDSVKGNGWGTRAPVMASLVKYHEFDIFGTQEGFYHQLLDLEALLPEYAWIGLGRGDGVHGDEHSAIFYRTDLFTLVDHGDFWLSETPDVPSMGWDAACYRICTWGRFLHKPSGCEFLLFNLHMDHVGKQARIESGHLVRRMAAEIGGNLPMVMMGDFNVDQTHITYQTIVADGALRDSFTLAPEPYALNGTFNDYKPWRYTSERIDHIFLSPQFSVDSYGILTDSYRTRGSDGRHEVRLPSDHYPVKVRVTLH